MDWFNFWGLGIIVLILIPNGIYALTQKDGFSGRYQNKVVEVVEQVGRFGCMGFMMVNIPYATIGFWFPNALTVYLISNGVLCLAYLLFWIILWKRPGLLRALSLSIFPSLMFLFSGILLLNIPLLVFSLLFAFAHIWISVHNA